MNIGANIKAIRKKKGLTQTQLANLIGSSKQMISVWENSERELTVTTLIKIANALEVGIDEFFLSSNPPNSNPLNLTDSTAINFYDYASQSPEVFGAFINDKGKCEVYYHDENQKIRKIVVSKNPLDNPGVEDLFKTLNKDGQQKLIEHAKLLAKIPEYQAGTASEPEAIPETAPNVSDSKEDK